MKNRIFLVVVTLLLLFSSSNTLAQKKELRGIWLTNVASTVMNSDKGIADAMDLLARSGFNVVFPVVYNDGYTLYPSKVMQDLFGTPIYPASFFQNRDPLAIIIREAHRNGMEVIPWFEYGFADQYGDSVSHIVNKFPEWRARDSKGKALVKNSFYWLNGINPEVQDYMLSLIMEVVRNYDIDGIQGDDRFPAQPIEGGYDAYTIALYKSENNGAEPPKNNTTQWQQWRASKLNTYFKRVRDSVKAVSPHLIISSAPSQYPWGYNEYLQDAKTWLEQGTIDNFIPQLYRYNLSGYLGEVSAVYNYLPTNKRDIFFPGILARVGSYTIDVPYFASAITENRKRNINGETYFFYEALRARDSLADTLKNFFYKERAQLPYRNGFERRPKSIILQDSSAANVMTGSWTYQAASPGFVLGSYWNMTSTTYSSIEYMVDVPADGWYNLFGFTIAGSSFYSKARYRINHNNGIDTVLINQQLPANGGWQRFGTYFLKKGLQSVAVIDNFFAESGKILSADALMLTINRKLSPDAPVVSIEDQVSDEIPTDFKLEQNFPNPFNPTTTIRFSLPEAANVTLSIYTILGVKVADLVHGYTDAGSHEVTFDASALPSGVYIATLGSGKRISSQKMMLLK